MGDDPSFAGSAGMPFATSSDLLTWLGQQLFLNGEQVANLAPVAAATPEVYAFCKELLRRDWLTPFQANHILKNQAEQLVLGANRLHSRLGEGAMGQVYKAWHVRLGRLVAVKTLQPDHVINPKVVDRFRREAQTAGRLVHPNIVLILDADEVNRCLFIVMEHVEGDDLARRVKKDGPLA